MGEMTKGLNSLSAPCICFRQVTIHGVPNLSLTMPKRRAKKVKRHVLRSMTIPRLRLLPER